MTTDDAKLYLAKREVPQLFECLLTGLMYHRPKEHVDYLIDCLTNIKQNGLDHVRWNLFIEQKRKTPLPPITPLSREHTKTSRPTSKKSGKCISREGTDLKSSPLPPISGSGSEKASEDQLSIENVPVVFLMGGPGSGKGTHCKSLVERYQGWVHLSMGDLIRDEVAKRGTSEEKWGMITDLLQKGEMAPEDVTIELLTDTMKKNQGAAGFIIEGYPRTLQQVNEYQAKVGRVDVVILLDCEEYYLQSRLLHRGQSQGRMDDNLNAITARISKFKNLTLPVIKHYDDRGQLIILDGDRDIAEIYFDLCMMFDGLFFKPREAGEIPSTTVPAPHPPATPRSPSGRRSRPASRKSATSPGLQREPTITFIPDIEVADDDTGRKEGFPDCPIIFVLGGPGAGRNTQCKKIVENFDGFVHICMGDILRHAISENATADEKWLLAGELVQKGELAPHEMAIELLAEHIKNQSDAKCFVLEGFPKNSNQVSEFNKVIGGINLVILLDCEEYTMSKRLLDRGHVNDRGDDNLKAIQHRITFFKNNILPLVKYYDDLGKLAILDGDKDVDEVYKEIASTLNFIFTGSTDPASDDKGEGIGDMVTVSNDVDIDKSEENDDNKKELFLAKEKSNDSENVGRDIGLEEASVAEETVPANAEDVSKDGPSSETSVGAEKPEIMDELNDVSVNEKSDLIDETNVVDIEPIETTETVDDTDLNANDNTNIDTVEAGVGAGSDLDVTENDTAEDDQKADEEVMNEEVICEEINAETANTTGNYDGNPEYIKELGLNQTNDEDAAEADSGDVEVGDSGDVEETNIDEVEAEPETG